MATLEQVIIEDRGSPGGLIDRRKKIRRTLANLRFKGAVAGTPYLLFPGIDEELNQDPPVEGAEHLACFYGFDVAPGFTAKKVIGILRRQVLKKYGGLMIPAYAAPRPVRPPMPLANPDRGQQEYLNPAELGVGAEAVWKSHAVDGRGVRIAEIEQGWFLKHEELRTADIALGRHELNHTFLGHGASVLGIIAAADNNKGGIGIAPKVRIRLFNQYRKALNGHVVYNTAQAIWRASRKGRMAAGDVLLLQAQMRDLDLGYVPAETEPCVYWLIRYLTAKNIVVVEPAANGGINLGRVTVRSKKPYSSASPSSGAFMVGSAASKSRTRFPTSNFGRRVDFFAWGENIMTCGDGEHGTYPDEYRTSFGGTSGAAAMVAGAVALTQQMFKKKKNRVATVEELRELLTRNGTASASDGERIGVMPDLERIAAAIDRL